MFKNAEMSDFDIAFDFIEKLWDYNTYDRDKTKAVGAQMLDQAAKLAKERDCKAMVLDSGLPRTTAHKFYEDYGFDKGCYGFDLVF